MKVVEFMRDRRICKIFIVILFMLIFDKINFLDGEVVEL